MTGRVGVCGAGGAWAPPRCSAIAADERLELVAAVDPHAAGRSASGLTITTDIADFAAAGCDVVVDFTTAAGAAGNVPLLLRQGIHAVVGTTGLVDDDLATFAAASAEGGATSSSPPTSRSRRCC